MAYRLCLSISPEDKKKNLFFRTYSVHVTIKIRDDTLYYRIRVPPPPPGAILSRLLLIHNKSLWFFFPIKAFTDSHDIDKSTELDDNAHNQSLEPILDSKDDNNEI